MLILVLQSSLGPMRDHLLEFSLQASEKILHFPGEVWLCLGWSSARLRIILIYLLTIESELPADEVKNAISFCILSCSLRSFYALRVNLAFFIFLNFSFDLIFCAFAHFLFAVFSTFLLLCSLVHHLSHLLILFIPVLAVAWRGAQTLNAFPNVSSKENTWILNYNRHLLKVFYACCRLLSQDAWCCYCLCHLVENLIFLLRKRKSKKTPRVWCARDAR